MIGVAKFFAGIDGAAYQIERSDWGVCARQFVLVGIVAVGAGAHGYDDVAHMNVHLACAARTYANDCFNAIKIEEFVRVDADGRNAHAVSHHRNALAVVGTRETEHTAHVVELYRIFQIAFSHQFGAQRVAGHDDGFGNFAVLCPNVRGWCVFSHSILFWLKNCFVLIKSRNHKSTTFFCITKIFVEF